MKTIGVIGGLGPQATIDFEARLHKAAERLSPLQNTSGYPPMWVYYHRRPPVVMGADMHPIFPLQPDPQLLQAAAKLGALADFLVITSNGVHHLQPAIEAAAGREVLSMIKVTVADVQQRQPRKVGTLDFMGNGVYQSPLAQMGIEPLTIPADLQQTLDVGISKYQNGDDSAANCRPAIEAVNWLREQGADAIILGCTEIPLMLGADLEAPDLINPAALLAEAAVRYAMA